MSDASAQTARPTTILVAALGGEGGGVLADWLLAAATKAGLPVQSTSIPGVAEFGLEPVPPSGVLHDLGAEERRAQIGRAHV